MEIKPCPNSKDGKHKWMYPRRKHGNTTRRFVACALCPQIAQESDNGVKFTTAREFVDKKDISSSYRTTSARKAEILSKGYTSINHYINESPVMQLPYIP